MDEDLDKALQKFKSAVKLASRTLHRRATAHKSPILDEIAEELTEASTNLLEVVEELREHNV